MESEDNLMKAAFWSLKACFFLMGMAIAFLGCSQIIKETNRPTIETARYLALSSCFVSGVENCEEKVQ
jgi:nitric oxide reductase large subunit